LAAETHQKTAKKAKIKVEKPQQQPENIFLALQKNVQMIYSPKQM
jgi:hypothetical protein